MKPSQRIEQIVDDLITEANNKNKLKTPKESLNIAYHEALIEGIIKYLDEQSTEEL